MEQTSIDSFHALMESGKLGDHQLDCVQGFVLLGGRAAAFELEEWWQKKNNVVVRERVMGKRISELRRGGVVVKTIEKKLNPHTERMVNVYELTNKIPEYPLSKKGKGKGQEHIHEDSCPECLEMYMDGRKAGLALAKKQEAG